MCFRTEFVDVEEARAIAATQLLRKRFVIQIKSVEVQEEAVEKSHIGHKTEVTACSYGHSRVYRFWSGI